MKRQTKIAVSKKQVRATIPKQFVEGFKVTKEDKMEWEDKNGKLKAELKKNE